MPKPEGDQTAFTAGTGRSVWSELRGALSTCGDSVDNYLSMDGSQPWFSHRNVCVVLLRTRRHWRWCTNYGGLLLSCVFMSGHATDNTSLYCRGDGEGGGRGDSVAHGMAMEIGHAPLHARRLTFTARAGMSSPIKPIPSLQMTSTDGWSESHMQTHHISCTWPFSQSWSSVNTCSFLHGLDSHQKLTSHRCDFY